MSIPRLALSVRQPWAWAIVYGHKPVENRSWRRGNPGVAFRGRVCIHAAAGITRYEWDDAADFIRSVAQFDPPSAAILPFGAIVGEATVIDFVKDHPSPWFMGPRALVLDDPVHYAEPIPCRGALGFFEWKRDDTFAPVRPRWMAGNSNAEFHPDKNAAQTRMPL